MNRDATRPATAATHTAPNTPAVPAAVAAGASMPHAAVETVPPKPLKNMAMEVARPASAGSPPAHVLPETDAGDIGEHPPELSLGAGGEPRRMGEVEVPLEVRLYVVHRVVEALYPAHRVTILPRREHGATRQRSPRVQGANNESF